jgi:hypothetical protein
MTKLQQEYEKLYSQNFLLKTENHELNKEVGFWKFLWIGTVIGMIVYQSFF